MAFERPLTVKEIVNDIHRRKYLLPAIQREFEWNPNQISTLFDSLLRGYPVGAFLFWYVNKENIHKFKFYEFLREYHERDNIHNAEANVHGEEDVIAILDGQQRLTSLYIGLKGTYAYKLPRKRKESDSAYPTRALYVNLLSESKDYDMVYDFQFLTNQEAQRRDEDKFWFRVGDILNIAEQSEINDYIYDNELNIAKKERAKFASNTLFRLHKVIHDQLSINYYLEKSQELDKVLNIFIRVNSGGTPLSYSDLLLSIATAQWEKRDARKTITSFVDEINNIGKGFSFNKDLVLKTCLVLCDFNDIAFKVDNFDSEAMSKIEEEWYNIAKAIRLSVELIASFGFSSKTLTANYVIIPIAYYFYRKEDTHNFVESYRYISERRDIQKFTTIALLKRVFGGQPDNVLKPIREIIKHNGDTFPFDVIRDKLKVTNKTFKYNENEIDELLWTKYGNRYAFLVLSLLYPTLDYRNEFHQDHIFPRSILRSRTKLGKLRVQEENISYYLDSHDYIGNLQLIEGIPNQEKSNKQFEDWLRITCETDKEKAEYRSRHLIPDVELGIENFKQFMEQREEVIKDQLRKSLL